LTLLADYWYCWLAKTSLLTLELESIVVIKVVGDCLSFPTKKPELIWTSRTQDMSLTPNNVWAAGYILTSLLLLRFELENGRIDSWTPHERFRFMS
jgi:hypothetical protein